MSIEAAERPWANRAAVDTLIAGVPGAAAVVRAAVAGEPLTVAVLGPGGSGKSALVGALLRSARRSGRPTRRIRGGDAVPSPDEEVALLLVDDAHRLDGDTVRALTDLADDPDARLVVTARPGPRSPALAELLRSLGRTRAPMTLGPLTGGGVAERVGAQLGSPCPSGLADVLLRLSAGHTALVDRLIAEVRESGPRVVSALDGAETAGTEVPASVLELVRHEVDDLDEGTRRLLVALAVEAPGTPALLADLLDVDRAVLNAAFDRARAAGLLLPAGGTEILPPLVARAVCRLGPADERIDLERRVAEQALARGVSVLAPARRLLGAGLRGDAVARVFTTAGDEAVTVVPALAGALYADAVAAGDAPESVAVRRAEAAALAGEFDTALRFADPLIASGPGEGEGYQRAAVVVATVLTNRGMGGHAADLLDGAGSLRPWAVANLVARGRLAEARRAHGDSGAGAAIPTISPTLRSAVAVSAEGILLSVETHDGAVSDALSALTRAASLAGPLGAGALLPNSPAAHAALVAIHSGDLDLAESVLRGALDASLGGPALASRHHLLRAWVAMLRGHLDVVGEQVAAARGTRPAFEPGDELFAAAIEVGVARRTGDSAALRAAWPRAREALIRHPVDLFTLLPFGEILVGAARLREQVAMRSAANAADSLLAMLGDPPLWRVTTSWYSLAAALTAEDVPAARKHLAVLDELDGRFPLATVLAAAARVWVTALSGACDAEVVEAAAGSLDRLGWSWDAARLAGEAAIRATDRRAMAALLACARSLAESARPGPDGESVRPPGVPTSGPLSSLPESGRVTLSEREREVARLVLDGLTQKQIGARLYISAKTVEHHVARMRQRLGSTSRGELFAQLREIVGD